MLSFYIGENMKLVTKNMIYLWNMNNLCWMGYKMSSQNPFTYHHITKRTDGGRLTIDNGAILTKNAHEFLNVIENKDLELYIYLNNMLKNINNQREMPNRQQLLAIDSLLRMFENEYSGKRNSKGNLLIKEEYTRRIIK